MIGTILTWVVIITILGSVAFQLLLFAAAGLELRRVRQRDRHRIWRRILRSPLAPRVSVLVPAYNEEVAIADSVRSLLALTYPNLEVVVVNDGSSDATMDALIDAFELAPVLPVYQRILDTQPVRRILRSAREQRLIVADKENGGKADALNAAINIATGELFCAIDADTLVAPDALQQLVQPFVNDPETTAVGGTVRLVNDASALKGAVTKVRAPSKWLVGAQVVEYTRAFLVGRLAWNRLGGNLIISGAFGVFRRDKVLEVDGYEHDTIGEDMELVVKLRRAAYERDERARVIFSPDPVAWTEAPESARTLARQRNRWYRGLLDVLVRHRRMILRRKYGSAGLIAMPYFIIVEALAPIVEAVGIILVVLGVTTGWVPLPNLVLIAAAYIAGVAASFLVMIFDDHVFGNYEGVRDRVKLVAFCVYEQLIFRPATVVWRLWGLVLFLRGRKEWGAQERKGFDTKPDAASTPLAA